MKRTFLYGVIIGLALLVVAWLMFGFKASATQVYSKTICHHTPGNQITLTFHTIQAYFGHLGQPHSGQTFDTNGACQEVTPTPTPTVTPTPPVECEKDCEEVTPTPTPVEPTPTPTDGPKGDSRGDAHKEEPKPPAVVVCTVPFEAPRVWYTKVNGKVVFNWADDAQGIQKYSITYGYSKDKLEYGVDNLPSTSRSLEIKGLTHSPVWFQVQAWKDGCQMSSQIIDP